MNLTRATYVRDFSYVPVPPFVVMEVSIKTAADITTEASSLPLAVRIFADNLLPIRIGRMCSIIDGTDRIVLQYWANYDTEIPLWWGVQASFTELDRMGAANPVDRAIWESIAREAAR